MYMYLDNATLDAKSTHTGYKPAGIPYISGANGLLWSVNGLYPDFSRENHPVAV